MVLKLIQKGNRVRVDYEGRLDDGTIFDTSMHGDHSHPIEFEVGTGQVIPGFDQAVIGMKKDEEKSFVVKAKDAYGMHNLELIQEIPRSSLPQDQEIKLGMIIMAGTPDGRQFPVKISGVSKDKVKIDLNHPLAGKDLNFKIKIVDVE